MPRIRGRKGCDLVTDKPWPRCAAGRGKGIKAIDLAGAYACTACDAAYDQMQGAKHMTREELDLDWYHGHVRSLVILDRKGLIK